MMEGLTAGQKTLLTVFATVCESIGGDKADEIVDKITNRPLEDSAKVVVQLQQQNESLQAQLREALEELERQRTSETVQEGRINEPNEPTVASFDSPSSLENVQPQDPGATPPIRDGVSEVERSDSQPPAVDGLDQLDLTIPENAVIFKAKYQRLRYRYQETTGAMNIAIRKAQELKENVRGWMAHADGLNKRIAKLEQRQTSFHELPRLPNLDNAGQALAASEHFNSGSTEGDAVETVQEPAIEDNVNENDPVIKEEEPDDLPVVVSSRVIRKRQAPRVSPEQVVVKSDRYLDSSPIGLAGLRHWSQPESLDLDADHRSGITPKKRRHADPKGYGKHRLQRSHQIGSLAHENSPILDSHYQQVIRDIQTEKGETTGRISRNQSEPKRSALQPRSPNKIVLPRTNAVSHAKKRRKIEDRVQGAELYGEDGEDTPDSWRAPPSSKSRQPSDDLSRRLTGLLDVPTTRSPILTPGKATVDRRATSSSPLKDSANVSFEQTPKLNRVATAAPTNRALNFGVRYTETPEVPGIKMAASSVVNTRKGLKTGKVGIQLDVNEPIHEPFRARPLRRLGLEHFKINPAHNQGYEYAFSDVVRGREQRKCLDGCTRPDCCGDKFRKMAEFMSHNQGEQTSSQEESDQRLMEDFMGHNCGKLRSMSVEEKREVLLQAKSRELSKKHGRHRTAYERRRSPPGFWRVDFPDTQEAEQDREDVARVERGLVEKRYNEAMREGGKWLFRDE